MQAEIWCWISCLAVGRGPAVCRGCPPAVVLQCIVPWENIPIELKWISVDSIKFLMALETDEPSNLFFPLLCKNRMVAHLPKTKDGICVDVCYFACDSLIALACSKVDLTHGVVFHSSVDIQDQTLRDIEQCFELLEVCVRGTMRSESIRSNSRY